MKAKIMHSQIGVGIGKFIFVTRPKYCFACSELRILVGTTVLFAIKKIGLKITDLVSNNIPSYLF